MCRADIREEYGAIAVETDAKIKLYETGGHPALLTNAEQASKDIVEFLK